MKKPIAITAMSLVTGFIIYTLTTVRWSSSAMAQGQPSFSINSIEVTEGTDPQAVFTVTFEYQGGFREFTTTVNYATSNGSAIAPGDYTQSAGVVTFPPGETPGGRVTMTVSVPIIDDDLEEGDETFTVALSNPSFPFILSPPGTCTIHDNDGGPPRLAILDTEITEGDGENVNSILRVGLNRRSNSDVLVDFATEGFSAVAGSDYVESSGTLTIPAGSISANIIVPVIGDTLPEWPERFFVRLSDARGAEITDDEGVCTILDDDDPEVITVCSEDTPIEDDEFTSVITVDRDIIVDDLEVRMHISQANLANIPAKVRLSLGKDSSFAHRLFPGGLTIPPDSGIGTTCSPVPDFAITDNAAERIQDHDGEAPYVGRWLSTSLVTSRIEGNNARGTYSLEKQKFSDISSSITVRLNCWCLVITAPREGLKLEPSRATLPVFDNILFDDEEDETSTLGIPLGGHYVKASLNTASGPAPNVPVTFTVRDRGGAGDILLTKVINTDEQGRAILHYLDWVPGEQTIEARAEINGAIYTDIARVTFLNPCAATQTLQASSSKESTLNTMRQFRDSRLARSKRGQNYSRLYYRFSSEAVQMMMLNPLVAVRSQQMIERYMPVLEDMAAGRDVTLTEGDLAEIDSFLSYVSTKGSRELRDTVKGLREDLRDREVHHEFGIKVTPGARCDLPGRSRILGISYGGVMMTLFGLFAFLGYSFTGSLRRKMKNHIKVWLCVILTALLVGCQWSAVSTASDRLGSRARLLPQIEVSTGSGSDRVTKATSLAQAGQSNAPGNLPARFEANQGQADQQIKFISRGKDYNLYLALDETLIALNRQQADKRISPQRHGEHGESVSALRASVVNKMETHQPQSADFIRMKLVGANSDPKMTGLEELPARTNYYRGKDRKNWQADIPSYAKVKYEQVYDGIDLLYYGNDGQIEYDFIVAPGADPRAIGLEIEGAEEVEIDSTGDLVLKTSDGQLRHRKPVVYQESNGGRRQIEGRYSVIQIPSPGLSTPDSRHPTFLVGFEIGEYDPSMPLVIDPVLQYSTYLGGSDDDQGISITVDSEGNAYVVGITNSINFPSVNAAQSQLRGTQDAFVAKLDPSGSRVVYITYLGGDGAEGAGGISLDPSGNLYVTGFTTSTDFPVMNPIQANKRGETNAFITKFGPTGNLLYSTYFGGSLRDFGTSVAVDQSGNILIAGVATSTDFPVANALQGNLGGAADVYVAKLNAAGNQLLYSTYLGGADNDGAASLAVDPSDNTYVTGLTFSPNFRTVNAIQGAHNGGAFDAFATKINPSGGLVYSTYLGGSGADRGLRIIADGEGNAYITGDTDSENFPSVNALQPTIAGSSDAFLVKLNPQGSQFVYSTYLGGSNTDGSLGIARDSTGGVYLTGFTSSSDFPTLAAVQAAEQGGTYDVFVAKVNAAGTALELSTYLGGSGLDSGIAVATDERGNAYVMGLTDSTDFPSLNGFQTGNGGGTADLFIAKIGGGPAITDVRIKGKNVLITGEEFERGAVILLNGEEQKTAFKSSTSLKGKKVGKKIGAGETARLQVRNPEGALSNEFEFRRP